MALLSRGHFKDHTLYTDLTIPAMCAIGMRNLRATVRAGGIREAVEAEGLPPDEAQNFNGAARVTLCKLYDDLVLRPYHASDEEQVFDLEQPLSLRLSGPADEYWLYLDEDGDIPGFYMEDVPELFSTENKPGVRTIAEGQHRMRRLRLH